MGNGSTEQDLERRIRRLYVALGATKEQDMSSLPAKVHVNLRCVCVKQDFSGGERDEEMELKAFSLISNIAHLDDHLQKWSEAKGMDKKAVRAHWRDSFEWQVIRDLNNIDKHGDSSSHPGWTKRFPRLVGLRRIMRLTTPPVKGGKVAMTLGPKGIPQVHGQGSATAVITGEVVDKDGQVIGDLDQIARKAIDIYEAAFPTLGISLPAEESET